MIRLFHLADLHFGHRTREPKSKRFLEKLAGAHSFTPNGPNYVLVAGDITDSGTEDQYERAFQYLDPFALSLMVLPGNHCFGRLGLRYDKNCVKRFNNFARRLFALKEGDRFGTSTPVVWHIKDHTGPWSVQVICLTSPKTSKTNKPLDFAQGCLGPGQLKQLEALLSVKPAKQQHRIVALHHRPFDDRYTMKLRDADAFMKLVLKPTSFVDAVCYGHSGHYEQDRTIPEARIVTFIGADGNGAVSFINGNYCIDDGTMNVLEVGPKGLHVTRERVV